MTHSIERKLAATLGYTRAGKSASWIARRLDVTSRTVTRYRGVLRDRGLLE